MRTHWRGPLRHPAARRVGTAALCLALLTASSLAHPSRWAHGAAASGPGVCAQTATGDDLLVALDPELCALCLGVGQARSGVPILAVLRVGPGAGTHRLRTSPRDEPGRSAPILAGHRTRAPPSLG